MRVEPILTHASRLTPHASVSRSDIVAEARSWKGTPWRHQGRLKGVACDCAGLVIGVARGVGLVAPNFDVNGYSAHPDPNVMRAVMDKFMDKQTFEVRSSKFDVGAIHESPVRGGEPRTSNPEHRTILPGDVLFLAPRRIAHHVAIVTGFVSQASNLEPRTSNLLPVIVHAVDKERGVREHSLPPGYRIVAVYRYRGISD